MKKKTNKIRFEKKGERLIIFIICYQGMKEFERGGLSDEKTITGFYKGIGIAHKGLKR